MDRELPSQEIATCTLFRDVILRVRSLPLHIVVYRVIDVTYEEVVDLLKSAHLMLSVIL